MKRSILAVGDPHARISTLTEIVLMAKRIAAAAKERKVDAIVVLGDLFNDFARIHSIVLRAVCAFFEELSEAGVAIYYVVGNHDMINNQVFLEDFHALTPFKKWPYLRIIDTPRTDFGFWFLPYTAPGRFKEAVGRLEALHMRGEPAPIAIFCHQEFRGAKMGMIESEVGDVWTLDEPLVVSGHVHDYAWLQPNILYVGAPMSQAFGEGDDKTISLLDFEDDKLVREERIDLGLPRRITVTLTVAEAKVYKVPPNTLVRVNLADTTEAIVSFKKSEKYTELTKTVKVVPKHTDKTVVRQAGGRKSFIGLLKLACATESPGVQRAFTELTQNAA